MNKRVIIVMDTEELAHLLQHVEQPLACPLTMGLLQLLGAAHDSEDRWSIMTTPGEVPFDMQVLPGIGAVMVEPGKGGEAP